MYFTILGFILCLALGIWKLCISFSWWLLGVVVFVCLAQLLCVYEMYKIKKEDSKLAFWNSLGEMSPELQKEIMKCGKNVVCGICGRVVPKTEATSFSLATGIDALAKGSKLRCTCKHCIKKRR